MMNWVARILTLGALGLSGTAAGQEMANPTGQWEISSRDSRYFVELCGDEGTSLCGTLIWLGGGADNEDNRPYLGTMIIDHAPLIRDGEWRGTLHLFGHTARGTITQTSNDHIQLHGCAFFVICRTYDLHRR